MNNERRQNRSPVPSLAAQYFLQAAVRRHNLHGFVLADDGGLLVVGPTVDETTEELAVVTALAARKSGDTVPDLMARATDGKPLHWAAVQLNGSRCFLGAVGHQAPDMNAACDAMQRIFN